jgi:hypothetical protein
VVVYVAKYPSKKLQGVYSLKAAKIDGAAATLYEAGHLQTLALYSKGSLNGSLKQWDETGQRLLYADFKNGRKHGLICLFRDGMPWLVQEWDKGDAEGEYLVQWHDDGPSIISSAKMSVDEKQEHSTALAKLDALQKAMNRSEGKLKRELADWFRKEDELAKQKRFVAGASDRRARERARSAAHAEQAALTNRAWWRAVLNQSGH